VSTPSLKLPIAHSAPAPDLTSGARRAHLVRRARALSVLTLVWMTVEAGIALIAALIAGSVALLGFGLDSLIELASAATMLWLYTHARSSSARAERRAQQLVTAGLVALAAYVTCDAIHALAVAASPHTSWLGVSVSLAAFIFMPLLARAKSRVAAALGSAATAGDAAQSRLCAISAAAVLISLLANRLIGWGWLDPIIGLGIAGLAVYEARQSWAGAVCADCAPITIAEPRACGCSNLDCELPAPVTDPSPLPGRVLA
jgi:divalent metal cation (Fe/Co/Zn/Cd) transporter